jgi:hypothetical protein
MSRMALQLAKDMSDSVSISYDQLTLKLPEEFEPLYVRKFLQEVPCFTLQGLERIPPALGELMAGLKPFNELRHLDVYGEQFLLFRSLVAHAQTNTL